MLKVQGIFKNFGHKEILRDIHLDVPDGELISLLGPSGCGKSTLLKILAGLEPAESGDIKFNGESLINLTPQKRPFNMVFQKPNLFPHLTVAENIGFGPKLRGLAGADLERVVENYLQLVGMPGYEGRMPQTLSGGQAQRVALARALANNPKVLLLDEPFSALDLKIRQHLQVELRHIQKKLGATFIFVTHDQDEAFALSDRIAIMNLGKIEQIGTPEEIYYHPNNPFVMDFVGKSNTSDVIISDQQLIFASDRFQVPLTSLHLKKLQLNFGNQTIPEGKNLKMMIRPESLSIRSIPDSIAIPIQISGKSFLGTHWKILGQRGRDIWNLYGPHSSKPLNDNLVTDQSMGSAFQLVFVLPENVYLFSTEVL